MANDCSPRWFTTFLESVPPEWTQDVDGRLISKIDYVDGANDTMDFELLEPDDLISGRRPVATASSRRVRAGTKPERVQPKSTATNSCSRSFDGTPGGLIEVPTRPGPGAIYLDLE
jgi:hypothetical protein